jgi:hypothetical protein
MTIQVITETNNYTIYKADGPNVWYFEHNTLGDERAGRIWFDVVDHVLTLIDYDGVFELPREVVVAVKKAGIFVEDDV